MTTTILTILGTGITVLIVVITAWINARVAIAKLEVQVLQLGKDIDSEHISNAQEFIKMDSNFKEVFKGLTDIKIALQNKEDRK